MTDFEIVQTMRTYGGSFVQALAEAWRCADPTNQATIKAAFPAYWTEYADLAARRLAQERRDPC